MLLGHSFSLVVDLLGYDRRAAAQLVGSMLPRSRQSLVQQFTRQSRQQRLADKALSVVGIKVIYFLSHSPTTKDSDIILLADIDQILLIPSFSK